ncbi:MAG: DUF3822 family protein [Crocinitomicaceae bacterium]|nr:DUF3822 family protein [Crocinitomicaceae bacterium]
MRILAVQISEVNARLNYFDSDSDTLLNQWDLTFNDKLEYRYKEFLNDYFLSEGIFKLEVDECLVSWEGSRSTLVPSSLFVESNASEIFKTSFGANFIKANIDFNRLAKLNIVNIFDRPLWLKSFFVLKYPSVIIQHQGSYLLKYLSQVTKKNEEILSVLSIQQDHFLLIIFHNEELKAYLTNKYDHKDDIIYHYANAFNQLNILKSKGVLKIISSSKKAHDIANNIEEDINNLKLTPQLEIAPDSLFILKAFQTCV